MTNQAKGLAELQKAKTYTELAEKHQANALKYLSAGKKKAKELPIHVTEIINKRRIQQGQA